jgi:hypothetical protein
MQKTNEIKSRINILAYYQIVGGAIGIIFLVWIVATTFPVQGLNILLYLFMAVLFGLSIWSGWLLVEKQIEAGLALSKINQLLQIVSVAFGGFAYEYVAGISLWVGINLENSANFLFNFSFSKLELYFNSNKDFARMEFNLVAIYMVYFIMKLQDTIANHNRLDTSNKD